ncbi:MAG: putative zinc-binding metallopeptidase, partial [Planctomycetota bacterium]
MSPRRRPGWHRASDETLLDLRFSDLPLRMKGTMVAGCIRRLYDELRARGLKFRPHFWFSTEWFCPDGVPGVAVPFYLGHPRLAKLEERQMLEVEGGTVDWCMKILRHETGHAIDNAFRLRRKKEFRRHFGRVSTPYPDIYSPVPHSKRFVLHLNWWYAQSHPLEDFAETFAVWLKPKRQWRQAYRGWPALAKLEYVDELMQSLAGERPLVVDHRQVDPLPTLRTKLRTHYRNRRERYGVQFASVHDRDLRRLFSDDPKHAAKEAAAAFLRR